MSLVVIKAGIMDMVQDAGRFGYRHLGINPSGAMDRYAMRVANFLVGNDPGEAVIEMHFPAAAFLFRSPALIALAGGDFSAHINGEPVPPLHAIIVGRNDVLQFHHPQQGARAYLAVRSGLATDPWLNSRSTNAKAGAGGFHGRRLQRNDELPIRTAEAMRQRWRQKNFSILPWKADTDWGDTEAEVAVLPGQEWEWLTMEAQENFFMTSFLVTRQSDRMGYRLDNIPLPALISTELVSSAVCFGTVQLLPDGKLIVLMADHQATGGYPRIAQVISAHHSKLAQCRAGERIRFVSVSQEKAVELYLKQEQHLQLLRNACTFRLDQYLQNHPG